MTELYLISGFLGAGKTTLLQKLLREGFAGQKVALVENDFGAVSLDAKLLKSGGYTVQELRAGCICCTLNGNFVSALVSLLRRVQPDVVLIEPSGVAKLSDVEALCRDHRLAALAVLKQKITVVDAANCASYCENFGAFFEDQVRCADTLVFSHSDAGTPQTESARRLAQKLNPVPPVFPGAGIRSRRRIFCSLHRPLRHRHLAARFWCVARRRHRRSLLSRFRLTMP